MGTFSPTEGGLRYSAIPPKLSSAGGVPQGNAQGVRQAQVRPSVQPISAQIRLFFCPIFVQLPCRFAAVAGVAQALQIPLVCEHRPVPLVVPDVVHVCGPDPQSSGGAGPAEGLFQQLRRAQSVPRLGSVHPAPGCRPFAPPVFLWLVGRAVAPGDQNPAPGSPARSQWPIAHGLSPPRQNKRARTGTVRMLRNMRLRLIGSGSNRYSKIAPVCIACSTGTPAHNRRGEGGSGASSGTADTVPKCLFRLSPTVYHSRS